MGALNPKFTESFEVWTDNYGVLIGEKVKPQVKKYCSEPHGISQPVLPAEVEMPKLWFHVILSTDTSSIKLAVRMDNLYLIGFCRIPSSLPPSGDHEEWWEFGEDGQTHLIQGAKWLGFGSSYLDLIGKHGKPEDVTLGRAQMSYAVDALAKYPSVSETKEVILEEEEMQLGDPYAVPKSMLVKLVIMICEGLRFLTVFGTVDKNFGDNLPTITKMEAIHVRKWEKISDAVFTWAADPEAKIPLMEEIGIKDKKAAAEIIALVKKQTTTASEKNKDEL
uniref:Uncharacterized protein n=1 Tax=Avena sativa TaxID=4498 RepID=A0ACD5YEJ2_AVESA